ncbi:Similar to tr/Q73K01/Q73K01 (fragment) [Microcystis aeruginosa PCC 9701]|uniref:Similar to tr/Q73K01/Q73K01 n=1 Tax=Microcystis aeruginosa PCC 9701 TaxID=721123 RepID=I4IP59_MICAE
MISFNTADLIYSVFQSAEVQKLWVLGKRQEAKVKREEKYVYLTSLGNAIYCSLKTHI